MTTRKPLVRVSGRTKELPAGDLIAASDVENTGLGGNVVKITTSGSHAIAAGTTAVLLALGSAGSVDLTLPTVADQGKTPIGYADVNGNLTGLTFAADAGDTGGIMGLTGAVVFGGSNGQGPGVAQSGIIVPSSDISGWFKC